MQICPAYNLLSDHNCINMAGLAFPVLPPYLSQWKQIQRVITGGLDWIGSRQFIVCWYPVWMGNRQFAHWNHPVCSDATSSSCGSMLLGSRRVLHVLYIPVVCSSCACFHLLFNPPLDFHEFRGRVSACSYACFYLLLKCLVL